jgi:ATP-dependent exoDNAse (exonuclease V) beta subunit
MSAAARFTPEQRHAIERRRGGLALAANAGSGKTSVLVERYVLAVTEDGIAPARILAITFTDRAAGELRERVRARLVAAGEREAARAAAGAFISTFHGFCSRLLRTHAVHAGLTPDFTVLGDTQADALREAAFDRAVGRWLDDPAALALASAFGVAGLRVAVESIYDELRSRGERAPSLGVPVARHDHAAAGVALARAAAAASAELAAAPASKTIEVALERLARATRLAAGEGDPPSVAAVEEVALRNGSRALASPACGAYEAARLAFEEACADRLGVPAVVLLDVLLRSFADSYEALKRARGAVDFDDLELAAGALLAAHEAVAALWSARFELLMVDELQDTNARQMAILSALDRDNLFTVGDEFQSIYGFRHADVGLFQERRARLALTASAGVLSTNFRSRPPLLDAVNGVFAARFGEPFVPLIAGRGEEERPDASPLVELLVADLDGWEGHEARLGVELAPAPLWRRAEARLLARRIDRLIAAGEARPEEIVLLFRAGGAIGTYEAALADLGHATLATTGGGFFARPEVVDLVAYLRALVNPLDELALYGVLASPLCGCSSDVLVALALRARELGAGVWEVLAAEPSDARCAAFAERFAWARRAAADRGLGEIVAAAVAENGYDRHLCALHSPERRMANVRKLERLAREFELREGRDLRRFAQALALGRVGSLRETEAPPATEGTGAIALMTIHSAKGLEFPVVCLADLGHQAPDSHPPALLAQPGRIGLRLPTLERRSIDTLDYRQLLAERVAAGAAEERRVIYVAMTRARERLILSGAARFAKWPAEGSTAMAWLGPALVADLPARAAGGGGAWELQGAGDVAVALTLCSAQLAPALLWDGELDGEAAEEAGPPPTPEPEPPPRAAGGPRPAPPAQSTLSYTAIADYERCGYRYHLQRVIGLEDVEPAGGAGEGAAARGVVVHALLQGLDFAAPRTPSEREVSDAAALAGVALDAREDRRALAELVAAFVRSPLCARLAGAREVRREEAFAFVFAGAELLRGFLDVAASERDGCLLIVDYKSDRVEHGTDLAAALERDYSLQRLVYALAGIASGAPVVEVAHCFLRRPEVVLATRYDASERERLETELAVRLAPLRAGRFEVSGDPNRERCGSCPGRARLCSHDEAMTLREPSTGLE